jgi:hypothetical protein
VPFINEYHRFLCFSSVDGPISIPVIHYANTHMNTNPESTTLLHFFAASFRLPFWHRVNRVLVVALIVVSLSLSGCNTIKTSNAVLNGPMTPDLERQVLVETGISGAFMAGSLTGGLVYLLAYQQAKSQGYAEADAHKIALEKAILAAVVAGKIGYDRGQEEGEKVVAKAMDRDRLSTLLRGARTYNERASSKNEKLRQDFYALQRLDPKARRAAAKSLVPYARSLKNDMDGRIAVRAKTQGNEAWDLSQRQQYRSEINVLKNRCAEADRILMKLEQQSESDAKVPL